MVVYVNDNEYPSLDNLNEAVAKKEGTLPRFIYYPDTKSNTPPRDVDDMKAEDMLNTVTTASDPLVLYKNPRYKQVGFAELPRIWLGYTKKQDPSYDPTEISQRFAGVRAGDGRVYYSSPVELAESPYRDTWKTLQDSLNKFLGTDPVTEELRSRFIGDGTDPDARKPDNTIRDRMTRVLRVKADTTAHGLFNNFAVTPDFPMATWGGLYKVHRSMDAVIDDAVVANALADNPQAVAVWNREMSDFVIVNDTPTEGELTLEYSMSGGSQLAQEQHKRFEENINKAFTTLDGKKLPVLEKSEKKISYALTYENLYLNKYLFAHLVRMHEFLSQVAWIDESTAASLPQKWKKTGFIDPKTFGRLSVTFSAHVHRVGKPTGRIVRRYIQAKISDAQSQEAIDQFSSFFNSVLKAYNENAQSYTDLYKQWLSPDDFRKYFGDLAGAVVTIVKEEKTDGEAGAAGAGGVGGGKGGPDDLKSVNPDLFIESYARNGCQFPPKEITKEEYERRKSSGQVGVFPRPVTDVGTIRYPSDGERVRYFGCPGGKTPAQYKFFGIKDNKLDNQDDFPVLPCCYKTSHLKKPIYVNYYQNNDKDLSERRERVVTRTYESNRVMVRGNRAVVPPHINSILYMTSTLLADVPGRNPRPNAVRLGVNTVRKKKPDASALLKLALYCMINQRWEGGNENEPSWWIRETELGKEVMKYHVAAISRSTTPTTTTYPSVDQIAYLLRVFVFSQPRWAGVAAQENPTVTLEQISKDIANTKDVVFTPERFGRIIEVAFGFEMLTLGDKAQQPWKVPEYVQPVIITAANPPPPRPSKVPPNSLLIVYANRGTEIDDLMEPSYEVLVPRTDIKRWLNPRQPKLTKMYREFLGTVIQNELWVDPNRIQLIDESTGKMVGQCDAGGKRCDLFSKEEGVYQPQLMEPRPFYEGDESDDIGELGRGSSGRGSSVGGGGGSGGGGSGGSGSGGDGSGGGGSGGDGSGGDGSGGGGSSGLSNLERWWNARRYARRFMKVAEWVLIKNLVSGSGGVEETMNASSLVPDKSIEEYNESMGPTYTDTGAVRTGSDPIGLNFPSQEVKERTRGYLEWFYTKYGNSLNDSISRQVYIPEYYLNPDDFQSGGEHDLMFNSKSALDMWTRKGYQRNAKIHTKPITTNSTQPWMLFNKSLHPQIVTMQSIRTKAEIKTITDEWTDTGVSPGWSQRRPTDDAVSFDPSSVQTITYNEKSGFSEPIDLSKKYHVLETLEASGSKLHVILLMG